MKQITTAQLKRTQQDFNIHAKSTSIKVTLVGQNIYAFGTELEMLRLFAKFLANGEIATNKYRVGYSENMKTYFFTYELPGFYN